MPDLRSDQAAIHVSVTGSSLDKNTWTSLDGGDITTTDTKTRPGGGGAEISLGGPPSRSNATVTRQYSTDTLHALVPQLEGLCGAAAMSVGWTPLDANNNPNGQTHTITGKLIEVQTTKRDANAPEAMFLTLVMSSDSTPTVIS